MPADTKPKPLSISISTDIITKLDARAAATGKTRSALIADDLTAYAEYLDLAADRKRDPSRLVYDSMNYLSLIALGLSRAKKKITRAEAMLILDVQNRSWVDGSLPVWISGGLAHQVADGCDLDRLDEKHGVDGKALVDKLENLGDLETVGLLDWAARFWESDVQEEGAVKKAVAEFLEG